VLRDYFYALLARYIGLYVQPSDSLVEVDPISSELSGHFPEAQMVLLRGMTKSAGKDSHPAIKADYVILNGILHYERDIQSYLRRLRQTVSDQCRLIVIYYSSLWRPLIKLATALRLRTKTAEDNWLSHSDVENLFYLADFEVLKIEQKILIPVRIPLLSDFVNRYFAPLPGLRLFCVANVLLARPIPMPGMEPPSVSVVIPARNEAGNIEQAVIRTPFMGPSDELIFVEGWSSDDTWETILKIQRLYGNTRKIVAVRQDGKGKGDAVRKGFAQASNEVLMILDADLTMPPEDLPKFYEAYVSGKGEFVNGSRLVYPMDKKAMRFINLLGNKFFASAFSFVLGQRFKDTLCGTKVLSKANYERLARNRAYFGDFDPFGDFDLIFGAARMGLRIVEVPISYRERTYGTTNISRWRHGAILLAMLVFAARRLKFV
jgi:glycosyl transferase family 2